MNSFIDNDSKSFVKKAMSLPLLEEKHELNLANKWKNKKDEKCSSRIDTSPYEVGSILCS